ncbi:MAG: L-ribulose-5-phosphate 4-epimerase AraD [Bacteroidota bacterium]|jgi:L-ribulose-5-phosphate 4-epimerase
MNIKQLKEQVLIANLDLVAYDLVTLTWGNVSGILRDEELVVIKPSGVEYKKLKTADMVVVDLSGKIVEGKLKPSSDTPTHIELYKKFKMISGIAHSHSPYATIFAQACKEIICLGTTHADGFYGTIPVTRLLRKNEVEKNYEVNTGKVIVERFSGLNYNSIPGVLVAGHAPFTWGSDANDAVMNNLILEKAAFMAFNSLLLNPKLKPLPEYFLTKHHNRKHGPDAYYGQKKK